MQITQIGIEKESVERLTHWGRHSGIDTRVPEQRILERANTEVQRAPKFSKHFRQHASFCRKNNLRNLRNLRIVLCNLWTGLLADVIEDGFVYEGSRLRFMA